MASVTVMRRAVERMERDAPPLVVLPPRDPVRLFEAGGVLADAWQAKALRSTASRQLWNVTRQGGKSTVAAALGLDVALYEPGAPVLLLSPSLRQSVELFKKVQALYDALGRPVVATAESVLRLELANGSRLVALPGKEATIRGYSGVRLLIADEASRIPDELYFAVRPMLAVSGGRLLAMSTPFGKRGFFHREWTEGTGWERVEVPATECPRISAAFLAEERASLPLRWYRQEYECSFEETEDAVFTYDHVHGALSREVAPLWPLAVPA